MIAGSDTAAFDRLQEALGHRFEDPELLVAALRHSSYAAEGEGLTSNERLEFLGDAVLQLVVTQRIYRDNPDLPEGQMAKLRAAVVSEAPLATLAGDVGVADALLLGRGEDATGGRTKPSILADAMEAVLGAVYLDGGYEAAHRVVVALWAPIIAERVGAPGERDYKTRLQEVLAQRGSAPPRYHVTEEGPDHAKQFHAVALIADEARGSGRGTSKKRAEQEAARSALAEMDHPDA